MARHLFHKPTLFHLFCALGLFALVALTGCEPSIGDECSGGTDCPAEAICDNTIEGGYCTVPDCELGGCPESSVCVIFDRDTTFCMATCESDADCREGLTCRKDNNFEGEPFGYCYQAEE